MFSNPTAGILSFCVDLKNSTFVKFSVGIMLTATAIHFGRSPDPAKLGLAYRGETRAENIRFLVDETWVDESGRRHVDQEIFDEVFSIIDEAEEYILLDFFLVNEFMYEPGPGLHNLSRAFIDRLLAKRTTDPEVEIIFITDPINTVYESIPSSGFQALEQAGIRVVWTDLNQLRDSNPAISKPWRLFVKPFGLGPGEALANPMGEGRISIRSMLKLINFKANHRKVVASEKSVLVTSANPHSGSSAHWNVALRIDGAGQAMVLESESAILGFSGAERVLSEMPLVDEGAKLKSGDQLELLTERRIKEKVLALLNGAPAGTRIDLCMFYFSDRDLVDAFIDAKKRGCEIRVILDPNKDAFGRKKNGIPNRQTAFRLVRAGIPLRWADTHGEQCHVKMLYVEHVETATLLLGSGNYTRRNLENYNAECNVAVETPLDDPNMVRARGVFDRWWGNSDGRNYTLDYAAYEDPSRWRRFLAWWMETTGMGTF